MIVKQPFKHETIRKCTIAFGGLFSSVFLRTRNNSGTTEKIVKVPLSYLNKEKFIVRLQQDPSLQEDVMVLLPRLGFEIVGMNYDASRQFNKTHKLMGEEEGRVLFNYAPVPWDIQFNLYSCTRTQEDNLQIMEQILPFFSPELSLTVKMLSSPLINQDIPLCLTSVSTDDQYDGSFQERRYIITTYSFTMKMYLYGPLLGTLDKENHFDSGGTNNIIKRVVVNVNNMKYHAYIDPEEANANDDFTIDEGWDLTIPREFDQDAEI